MTTEITIFLIVSLVITAFVAVRTVRAVYRHEFLVNDGYTGLLYHEGKISTAISPGRHVFWGQNYRLALVDTRKALLVVPGQDVITADNIGVKVSVVLTIQIVDVIKSVQSVDNTTTHIYSAAQSAVRASVASVTMDALLNGRLAIGTQLREALASLATALGVQVHSVEVRDVMLPGDLRKAFSEVLKARQDGLASLERARGESAALRNLANAARLIETQPALATLRFLQTLESAGASQTIVMNDLSAFMPALNNRGKSQTAEGE